MTVLEFIARADVESMQRILICAVKLGIKSTTERAWDSRVTRLAGARL